MANKRVSLLDYNKYLIQDILIYESFSITQLFQFNREITSYILFFFNAYSAA